MDFSGDRKKSEEPRFTNETTHSGIFADLSEEERERYLQRVEREESETLMLTAAGLALTAFAGVFIRHKLRDKEK